MNYYGPAQIQQGENAGKWVYISHNRRTGTFTVGYCTECEGHDTSEEACEHYRQWLMDNAGFWEQERPDECRICKTWTKGMAELPKLSGLYPLCYHHQNCEALEQVVGKVGRGTASV